MWSDRKGSMNCHPASQSGTFPNVAALTPGRLSGVLGQLAKSIAKVVVHRCQVPGVRCRVLGFRC